jgi:DNA-binding transcriptional regulator YdaS (Cro superfamily)
MWNTIHARSIQRAAEIAGGAGALAFYLKVPSDRLEAWAKGAEEVPPAIFLKVVDIILDRQLSEIRAAGPQT